MQREMGVLWLSLAQVFAVATAFAPAANTPTNNVRFAADHFVAHEESYVYY